MTNKHLYEVTSNPGVWKKLHKEINARCSRCPWHDFENASKDRYSNRKNWKNKTKNKKQWQ